jgi:AcrR family transcriptional regulator
MVQKRRTTAVRRKQIVSAARRLIIKQGAEHVTVRRIASEVGITEAAVYRHFKSKKDILRLLLDDIELTLVADIASSRKNGIDSLDVLDSILRHHLSTIERRRGVSFQVIAEVISLGDRSLNRRASETIDTYISCLGQMLADGIKSGHIRSDIDLLGMATLLFSVVQGVVSIWGLSGYSFDPTTRYEPMWKVVRQALEPQ